MDYLPNCRCVAIPVLSEKPRVKLKLVVNRKRKKKCASRITRPKFKLKLVVKND